MTLVASCDQKLGTSQLVCSKRTSPFSPLMAAERTSHWTVSKTSTLSAGQKVESILSRPWKRLGAPARDLVDWARSVSEASAIAIINLLFATETRRASYHVQVYIAPKFASASKAGTSHYIWGSRMLNPEKGRGGVIQFHYIWCPMP